MRLALLLPLLLLAGCFDRPITEEERRAEAANLAAQNGTVTALASAKPALGQAAAAGDAAAAARRDFTEAAAAADSARGAQQLAKDIAVAQAASNLGPIAAAVDAKGLPAYAAPILAQKSAIDTTLALPPALYPKPQVSLESLLKDAEASLAVYRKEAEATQGKIAELTTKQQIADAAAKAAGERADRADAVAATAQRQAAEATAMLEKATEEMQRSMKAKEEAEAAASAEARNAFLAKCGTATLAVLGPIVLAILNGATGGGLGALGTVARTLLPAAGRLQDQMTTAQVAVAGADVGRAALSKFEGMLRLTKPEIAAELAAMVNRATGGRAATVEELFRVAAQSHVIDLGDGRANAVAQLMMRVRDEHVETMGGMPTSLNHVLVNPVT